MSFNEIARGVMHWGAADYSTSHELVKSNLYRTLGAIDRIERVRTCGNRITVHPLRDGAFYKGICYLRHAGLFRSGSSGYLCSGWHDLVMVLVLG